MNRIRIVADSSCDLITLDEVSFVSVPLTIRTETQEFRDDASLDVETMVDTLRSTKGRSYSACPSVADWERAFGEDDDVLAFTITSGLSGSFRAACAAKLNCEENSPSRRICIIDSLSTGPEIVLLIEKAVSELSAGADFDAVCRSVQDYQHRTHLIFALESLHNLAQNGRVGKLAAAAAGMLGIRAVGTTSDEGTLDLLASAAAGKERRNSFRKKWNGSDIQAAASESGIAETQTPRKIFAQRLSAAFRMQISGVILFGGFAATMRSAAVFLSDLKLEHGDRTAVDLKKAKKREGKVSLEKVLIVMYNRSIKNTLDKAQQGLLTERGMPPCILLIASRPALRERDIGTASMGEAGKIEPVLEARKLDRTVCLRAFSILSPEMYPKACSRQNEKIKLHRPSLFSLRSGSAKEAENADGMTSENASHKNSGAPESLSLFLLPPYHSSGAFGTVKPPHTVPLYQTHRML